MDNFVQNEQNKGDYLSFICLFPGPIPARSFYMDHSHDQCFEDLMCLHFRLQEGFLLGTLKQSLATNKYNPPFATCNFLYILQPHPLPFLFFPTKLFFFLLQGQFFFFGLPILNDVDQEIRRMKIFFLKDYHNTTSLNLFLNSSF